MGGEGKMKKVMSHYLINGWIILSLFVFSSCPTFAFETEALIPSIEIFTPGMTRTMEITQNYKFPQDSSQFLILAIGYGGLSITLRKVDTVGDLLVLTGLGISSAGIVPIFRFGITGVTLTEAVEIGSESSPFGLLWITSWVDSPAADPPYSYTLTLSF